MKKIKGLLLGILVIFIVPISVNAESYTFDDMTCELDDDLIEVYDMIASRRGALSRGGVADYERVSHIIIQDFKNGYFGPVTFDRLTEKE